MLPLKCPYCGALHDGHTSLFGVPPEFLSLSICVECTRISVVDEHGHFRRPNPFEMIDILREMCPVLDDIKLKLHAAKEAVRNEKSP